MGHYDDENGENGKKWASKPIPGPVHWQDIRNWGTEEEYFKNVQQVVRKYFGHVQTKGHEPFDHGIVLGTPLMRPIKNL